MDEPRDIEPTITPLGRGRYSLLTQLLIPRPSRQVFAFFLNANNLVRLTPPWMGLSILGPFPLAMCEGALIDFRIRLSGMPLRWQSRIMNWDPPHGFVDVQARGPFRSWVQRHSFRPFEGGTLIRDEVEYAPPLGALAHKLFVRANLLRIFEYRRRVLPQLLEIAPSAEGGQ